MRIKISEEFEIPNSLAGLILGGHIDSSTSDFVITMDAQGAKRFSMILNCLYQDVSLPEQSVAPRPIAKMEPLKVIKNETTESTGLNMMAMKNKARKFIDNGS